MSTPISTAPRISSAATSAPAWSPRQASPSSRPLFGRELAGFGAEMLARVGARGGGGLEGRVNGMGGHHRIALAVIAHLAHGQAERAVLVLRDQIGLGDFSRHHLGPFVRTPSRGGRGW